MVESSPHIVALQDIPTLEKLASCFCNYQCFFPPSTDVVNPDVAVYVHVRLLNVVSIFPLFFDMGDLMEVNLYSPESMFDASHTLFGLYNAYSIASGHCRSVSPLNLIP